MSGETKLTPERQAEYERIIAETRGENPPPHETPLPPKVVSLPTSKKYSLIAQPGPVVPRDCASKKKRVEAYVHEKNQKPPTLENTLIAIDKLDIECRYDIFHNKLLVNSHLLEGGGVKNLDNVALMLRAVIIKLERFDPGKNNVFDALTQRCLENSFDPVKDYLDGLRWDGFGRIDKWLTTHLGAEDNPLNCAIGRKMLIAAVRRVQQPGCKFDYIVVMDRSQQGVGKSTVIQILAGEGNFSDQEILLAGSREHQEYLEGVWLFELGELSGLHRTDANKLKSFASRQVDRARPAYGRSRVDRPRRCIFIGTTNDPEYLQDPTGNRRFWPFTPGKIDLEAVRRDRDQLWAEAAAAEAKGEVLTIPEALWPDVEARQQSRLLSDPWEEALAGFLSLCPLWPSHRLRTLLGVSTKMVVRSGVSQAITF